MTPQAALHNDRQAITAQYVKYAYDFDTRHYEALEQLLMQDCQFDVRGVRQPFLPYVYQEAQHSEILKIKVLKVVVKGNTATALVEETNWLKGGPPSYSPMTRQDFLVRTTAGWRIRRIHTTGVTLTVVH